LISGFGKFCVKEKSERKGRNPATGEALKIKASNAVKFKAGKTLKDAI
jgi:DNA-binding protein HU-beta